jgi:hypothetical protein
MQKEYGLVPLVIDSSTLATSEVNANTELYMWIWSRNLTALLSLLVRTSSSCGVVRRLGNRTLPFTQHIENCGLLLLDFANCSLIHIFTLQNPQIVSISPQSHRVEANASSSLNNCNASLPKEGCACVDVYCMVRCSQCKWYFALVAFQMAQPTLYVTWHVVLFVSDCDIHMQILMCLDWIMLEH